MTGLAKQIAAFHLLSMAADVVADLKTKYPNLSADIDYLVQRDPTKQYLNYEVSILASHQGTVEDIAKTIDLFRRFKDQLPNKDISFYNFSYLSQTLDMMQYQKSPPPGTRSGKFHHR